MKSTSPTPLDLAALRSRLAATSGRDYWRSLDELAATPEFEELLRSEYPRQAAAWMGPLTRRSFLKLMGASLGLAGLSGCRFTPPQEQIVPSVRALDVSQVPGKPLFFATATTLGGYALGVLAESHEGRPTKIEGNDRHPASLGATDVFAQASLLELYDPDRAQAVLRLGRISTWATFTTELTGAIQQLRQRGGAGLRILTETTTSPTLGAQLTALLRDLPEARWHQYDPAGYANLAAGAQLAFGQPVSTVYDLSQAATIVALDADFLHAFPGSVRYARQFVDARRVATGASAMNRLYAVESTPTITGAMADHRLPLRASAVEAFARSLAQAVGVAAGEAAPPTGVPLEWLSAVAQDLQQHRGTSLVLAGQGQPPAVHALAHAINAALGNVGRTVRYIQPVEAQPPGQGTGIAELAADMAAGNVDTLVMIGGNPALTAPAELHFADMIGKVRLPISMSLYPDETAALCYWHVPMAHTLETWSDARAFDGTATIMQPLIQPLYQSHSPHELVAALGGDLSSSGYELVRGYWSAQPHGADFDGWWQQALNDGVVPDSALPTVDVTANPGGIPATGAAQPAGDALEAIFRPDPHIWDGRFSNNGWLQELPKPLSSLTWDNAALVSVATAQQLGLQNGDVVDLQLNGQAVRAPVWIMPGHVDGAVTLHLGYGRTRAGNVGNGAGFNAYPLRSAAAQWFAPGLTLVKTGERSKLASVQDHYGVEGRDLVREGTFAAYTADQTLGHGAEHEPITLYPEASRGAGHAWGMAIDLNACIGCNACTIACQAENNIPVVGKEQVIIGREMHWIKVDTYFRGDLDNPATSFQPRPCMHCEKAPCEVVCPTEATVHTDEGLNAMVYNRCIGTRYCSNNCPYKVRRFNFLQYADLKTPVLKLERNPEVTVRERGVMEKCTYCVQRIQNGRINAERDNNRPLADGEIQTACQQACPTRAIVFGDLNDPGSAVSQLKAQPLSYGMLAELGTQPRTSYLARLRNPNPALEG